MNAAVVTFDSDFHSILANINGTLPSAVRIRVEGLKAPELAKLLHKTIQLAKQEILDGSAIDCKNIRDLPYVEDYKIGGEDEWKNITLVKELGW